MPFRDDEVRIDLTCGRTAGGRCRGWFGVRIDADALRRLGLHPDQPASKIVRPYGWHGARSRR